MNIKKIEKRKRKKNVEKSGKLTFEVFRTLPKQENTSRKKPRKRNFTELDVRRVPCSRIVYFCYKCAHSKF